MHPTHTQPTMPGLVLVLLLCGAVAQAAAGQSPSSILFDDESTWGRYADAGATPSPPALRVLWSAPFFSGGGYCSEATSFALGLLDYVTLGIDQHGDSMNWDYMNGLPVQTGTALKRAAQIGRNLAWRGPTTLSVCHSEPGAWHPAHYSTSRCPSPDAAFTVGRTMFETDRVPSGWAERMNNMDEVWVPTKFHRDIFAKGGVDPSKLVVVPEPTDVDFFDPAVVTQLDLGGDGSGDTFRFLSVFKWEYRKGWDVLLRAYISEFTADDPVVLYILTSAYHSSSDFMAAIRKFVRLEMPEVDPEDMPRLEVLHGFPQTDMPRLYKSVDAFVLPSRGEGWGRPHTEAMSMGLPVIATEWSGPSEYMTTDNSFPLRHDSMQPIPEGAFAGHLMAEPSVVHLRQLMTEVVSNPDAAAKKGRKAREDMVSRFHPQRLARYVAAHIDRISQTVQERSAAHSEL